MGLTFKRLAEQNRSRCNRWHPKGIEEWSVSDWAVATTGELGEACNAIKKLRRIEDDLPNRNDPDRHIATIAEAKATIGSELADTLIYLDMLAQRLDINLEEAVCAKFNKVSTKYDFPEQLP